MIDIKRKDGTVRLSVEFSDSSLYRKELMVEEYATLFFSTDSIVRFSKGDYIETEFGKFEIVTINKPKENSSTGGYDYEQRFDGFMEKLKTRILFYDRQSNKECMWKLTQKPSAFLSIICSNIKALGWGQYSYSVDASLTEMKNLNFDSTSIFDALTAIAEAWGVEWWIDDDMTIHLSKCEHGEAVILSMDSEVVDMDRSEGSSSYATRVYAFGSTRNIPTNYRGVSSGSTIQGVVEKRLKLPVGIDYVDAWANMADEDVVEAVVNFDEIYPKRVGSIAEVSTKQYTETKENTDGNSTTETWNAYRFKDKGITFSKNYIIPGQELRIVFQTGVLAGMDFAVSFEPNTDGGSGAETQVWEIVRNEDYGINLPNDSLKPQVGDTYVLYGFDIALVSNTYVSTAEQELLTAARAHVQKVCIENATFTCNTNPIKCAGYIENAKGELIYAAGNIVDLGVGQKVTLINDNQFGSNGFSSRIFAIEKLLCNKFSCKYSVGGTAKYSRLSDIENKAVDANDSADKNKEEIRSSKKKLIDFTNRRFRDLQETTKLIEQSLLNFSGSINPMSVKAMQLLVGDESLQFRFVDSKASPKVVVHNITVNNATKRLFAPKGIIQHLTIGIKNISPTHAANEYRYWDMADFTSPYLGDGTKPYYLYAEVDKVNGSGVFVLSESPVAMEKISGKYYLLIGILNSEFEGERSFVTLYGYSEILPGRITTEKIVSPSGNTFFDLVNDIIQGKITFTAGSSGLYNLYEWAIERQKLDDEFAASKDAVAQNLGYTDFAELNDKAIAGETIIEGGRLRNSMIDTDALFAQEISAKNMTVLGGRIGDFEVRSKLVGSGYTGGVANGNQIILDPSNNEIVMAKNGVKKVRLTNETLTALADLKKDGGTLNCSSGSASPVKKTSVLALYASRNDIGVGGAGLSRNNAIGRLSGVPKVYNTIEAIGKISLQPAFYSFDVPYVVNIVHSGDQHDGRYDRIAGTNICKVEVRLVGPAGTISTYKDEFRMSVDSGDSGNSYSFNRMARFNFSVATAAQFWIETTFTVIGSDNPIRYQSYNHATTFRHSWWSSQNNWDVQYELSVAPGMSIDGSIGLTELSSSGFQSVWTDHRFIRIDGNVNNTTFIESEGKWVHNGVEVKFDTNTITGYIDPTRFASRDYIDSGFYTKTAADGRYLGITAQAADSAKLGGIVAGNYYHAGNFNTDSVAVTGSTLTAASGAIVVKGSDYPQLQFMKLDGSFRMLFRAGDSLRWRYDGTNDGTIFHSGNANLTTVDWTCAALTANSALIGGRSPFLDGTNGSVPIADLDTFVSRDSGLYSINYGGSTGILVNLNKKGGSASAIQFEAAFSDVAPRFRLAVDNNRYASWYRIYTTGNANLSSVDWAARSLTASSATINGPANIYGTITGVSGIISLNGLTDANTVITGPLPLGLRFDRGSSGFLNTPYNANNANGLLTLTSHLTGGTGPYGKQFFFTDNEELYIRRFSNGTALPWRNLYHSGNANLSTVDWNANTLYSKLVNVTGGAGLITESGLINFQNNRARIGYDGTSQGLVLRTADASKNIVFALGIDGSNEKARINTDGFLINGVVKSSNQNGSGFTAAGWQIGDYSNLNNLDVRSRLQVYEFVQNKINISNGNLIVTDSSKAISVDKQTSNGKHVRYFFSEACPFSVGDFVRVKSATKDFTERVDDVAADKLSIAFFSVSDYVYDATAAADLIVRWNSEDANKKGLLYLNSSDTNAPNFQVIYNNTPKAVLGNIAGLNWKGTAIAANKYGVWADGDIYINNGYFSGEVNVTGGNAETTTGSQSKADAAKNTAISTAASDATSKANTAQSTAISTAATNTDTKINAFKGTLGSLAYDSLVEKAKLGSSLISGGYIKTDLLDVNTIIVGLAKTTEVNTAMNAAISSANTNTTNVIGNKFTYINGSGIYTGTLTANQITATNAVFSTTNIADAAITDAKIASLSATKIQTGTLNVGGTAASKIGDLYVRDASNNIIAQFGSINKVFGWNFNANQLYQGTALTDKTLGTADGQMTIGNGYISAKNWYVGRDGSGNMAKGALTWDAAGNGSIGGGALTFTSSTFAFSDAVKLVWQNDVKLNVLGNRLTQITKDGVYTGEVRADKIVGEELRGKSIIGLDSSNNISTLLDGRSGRLVTYQEGGVKPAMQLERGELKFYNENNMESLFIRNTNVSLSQFEGISTFEVYAMPRVYKDGSVNSVEVYINKAGTYSAEVDINLYGFANYDIWEGKEPDLDIPFQPHPSIVVYADIYLDKKVGSDWVSQGVVGYVSDSEFAIGRMSGVSVNSVKKMKIAFTVGSIGVYRYRMSVSASSSIEYGGELLQFEAYADMKAGFITGLLQNGTFIGINGFTTYNYGANRYVSVDINSDTVLSIKGKTDMSGVLLSGKVYSSGYKDSSKLWGAKAGAANTRLVSTGVYEIAHNLGHQKYVCIPQFANSAVAYRCMIRSTSELDNTCTVEIRNGDGNLANIDFNFMLVGYNY